MCPSYIATRQEEHSTRGRANALVKALSEPDPHAALGDERLHEILDLCLMCKACKSECPLGVDMAALKAETLAHHHDLHGIPLRSRVFGAIRFLNRLGSATAPLSNLPNGIGPLRAADGTGPRHHRAPAAADLPTATTSCAGSPPTPRARRCRAPTRRGHLPRRLVHHLHRAGDRRGRDRAARARRLGGAPGQRRLLRPGELLQGPARRREGQGPRLAERLASSLGAGLADRRLRTVLRVHAAGRAPPLLPDDPHVRDVAGRVRQVEELLVEAIDAGALAARDVLAGGPPDPLPRALPPEGRGRHGGHHRAAAPDPRCRGRRGRRGLLRDGRIVRLRGRALRAVDDGRERPAVPRDRGRAGPDTVVAATGVSCRQQIFHGTDRSAWHPVELVRAAYEDGLPVPS